MFIVVNPVYTLLGIDSKTLDSHPNRDQIRQIHNPLAVFYPEVVRQIVVNLHTSSSESLNMNIAKTIGDLLFSLNRPRENDLLQMLGLAILKLEDVTEAEAKIFARGLVACENRVEVRRILYSLINWLRGLGSTKQQAFGEIELLYRNK